MDDWTGDSVALRARLAAILNRTGSSHVAEADTAWQMANALLAKAGLTWERVLLQPAPAATRHDMTDTLELLTGQWVPDPRNRRRSALPPHTTWRNSMFQALQRARKPPRQVEEYLSKVAQAEGPLTDLWRPSWPTACCIVRACGARLPTIHNRRT